MKDYPSAPPQSHTNSEKLYLRLQQKARISY